MRHLGEGVLKRLDSGPEKRQTPQFPAPVSRSKVDRLTLWPGEVYGVCSETN